MTLAYSPNKNNSTASAGTLTLSIMNYFNALTKSTQRAIAYAVIFATLTAFVLVMDFALWLINTTFA